MTAPVPDGTTPPPEAVVREVLVKAVYRIPAERRLFPDMWADDVAAAVVAALNLPERDRETEVKVRGEAVTQERLGENIRRAIQAAGMTQKDVAERAEIDPTALSKIVTGKRRVSSLELALICTATGSDVLGLLEAEPIHGPSYRAGLEEGAHWAALREGREP
jgi:predicted XRE-type DNA-binding protein